VVGTLDNKNTIISEWKKLYEAAVRFKEIECWKWMFDTDIFAVEDIDTHEMGYCCVMGNARQAFGLSIYLGDRGLKSYMDTLYQSMPYEDLAFAQNCIILNFEDRDALDKDDLNIIKQVGLKFRGRNQWPRFRNYKPNYYPSHFERSEVKYMTYVLEQVISVVLRCREDKKLVESEDQVLVRVSRKVGEEVVWEDKYTTITLEDNNADFEEVNELALKRIKDSRVRKSGVWEVDFFNVPALVKEEGRPYYPLIFMVAEVETGVMLNMKMTSDFEGYIREFQDEFIDLLAKSKKIPEVIVVQRKRAFQLIEPIAIKLGVEVQPVEELLHVREFRMGLEEFL
jgi:hypothetical protein